LLLGGYQLDSVLKIISSTALNLWTDPYIAALGDVVTLLMNTDSGYTTHGYILAHVTITPFSGPVYDWTIVANCITMPIDHVIMIGNAAQISVGIGQTTFGHNTTQGFNLQLQGGASDTTLEAMEISYVASATQVPTNARLTFGQGSAGNPPLFNKQWVDAGETVSVNTGLPLAMWNSTFSVIDFLWVRLDVPSGQEGTGPAYFTQVVYHGNGTAPTLS